VIGETLYDTFDVLSWLSSSGFKSVLKMLTWAFGKKVVKSQEAGCWWVTKSLRQQLYL